ncbi:ABC transporter ATP-binding protein [Micromonospora sp. NBC_00898]|uniref:ABC transporter ATP-binding protein n=1 Tax=Micromonospora sp. NBC_00898 TaxID=2975981 RepID=UPI0038638DCD|nr:ABC transporter ATP-binding protein [Micromonospora sp. NBC_00898]
MSESAIVADGLTKRFGALTAVSELTLTVDPGQIMGFLGPNGAGKTTTIRMLLGFLKPTAGAATVLGAALAQAPRVRRRVGYLPGDLRVEPGMTGTELFAFFGRLRGGVRQGRVDELVQRLDLDPSRPFGTLSKGNRQKVGIVQALCHDPDVLILDEPTTGLDPLVQREFLTLVTEAAQDGAAVLFSSHVLPEVERMASRVAIIRAGGLVRVAAVDELLDHARRRLEFRFADPPQPGLFDGVPGVVDADYEGRLTTVTVDGPVGPALRAATEAGTVLRVNPIGDDLEDLFLSLYQVDAQPVEVA